MHRNELIVRKLFLCPNTYYNRTKGCVIAIILEQRYPQYSTSNFRIDHPVYTEVNSRLNMGVRGAYVGMYTYTCIWKITIRKVGSSDLNTVDVGRR